jgi:hypothetical protein
MMSNSPLIPGSKSPGNTYVWNVDKLEPPHFKRYETVIPTTIVIMGIE